MSFIDSILDKMGLGDDYYDDDEFYDEEEDFEEPPKKHGNKKSAVKEDDLYDDYEEEAEDDRKAYAKGKTVKPNKKVTPINSTRRKGDQEEMEVCVVKPTSVEDSREITETLLNGRTVVLNLEGLDIEIAQRIIDFTSGSCFAISGNLQKISNYIFIITPHNVDIFGDFQDILNGTINVSAFRSDY